MSKGNIKKCLILYQTSEKKKTSSLLGNQLKQIELQLGGIQRNVKRNQISANDQRKLKWYSRGMVGGDKMLQHDYAEIYAAAINYISNVDSVAEIGILRGHGLAMWSVLFPHAELMGADIDLDNFTAFKHKLESRGAFKYKSPTLLKYDQLRDSDTPKLKLDKEFDIIIDDGLHTQQAIQNTIVDFWPYLRSGGIYIIEDIPIDFKNVILDEESVKVTLNFSEAVIIIKN